MFAMPPESSARLLSLTPSPMVFPLAAVLVPKAQEASSEILKPPLVIAVPPAQLAPDRLFANMLLVTVNVPVALKTPPP